MGMAPPLHHNKNGEGIDGWPKIENYGLMNYELAMHTVRILNFALRSSLIIDQFSFFDHSRGTLFRVRFPGCFRRGPDVWALSAVNVEHKETEGMLDKQDKNLETLPQNHPAEICTVCDHEQKRVLHNRTVHEN